VIPPLALHITALPAGVAETAAKAKLQTESPEHGFQFAAVPKDLRAAIIPSILFILSKNCRFVNDGKFGRRGSAALPVAPDVRHSIKLIKQAATPCPPSRIS